MSRSHAEMAQMRALCDPSDPRDGRVLHQIRLAFWSFEGVGTWKPKGTPPAVTTKYLMSFTYPWEYQRGELKSWHRTNTIKAARMVAIPTRRKGKGHGFVWTPISEEVLTERNWQGKSRRRQRRRGLPID
jgi:hypothetical protein